MLMKIERVQRNGYTMVYNISEAGVDFDQTDDLVMLKVLARYELHEGYRVWQVGATYARNIKPPFYYIVSTSKVDAMSKFLSRAPWLSFVNSIVPLNEDDAATVLSNPAKFILW